jgi:hypothetical protein
MENNKRKFFDQFPDVYDSICEKVTMDNEIYSKHQKIDDEYKIHRTKAQGPAR